MDNITWATLVAEEPRLLDLYNFAASVQGADTSFCANTVWQHDIKPILSTLVGWDALTDNEILCSAAAYELALSVIYDELPACKNCGCLREP